MDQADKILDLIQSVSLADVYTIHEINALFWMFKNRQLCKFICITEKGFIYKATDGYEHKVNITDLDNYDVCHSRDALKAVRPDDWQIVIIITNLGSYINITNYPKKKTITTPDMMPEELAELHAIIQAWKHVYSQETIEVEMLESTSTVKNNDKRPAPPMLFNKKTKYPLTKDETYKYLINSGVRAKYDMKKGSFPDE